MTPQERYEDLVDEFTGVDGVTPPQGGSGFGRGALRYRRKIFAMFVRGQLVVKLPAPRVNELVTGGHGEHFDANKGTPMREWFSLDPGSALAWPPLAREALDFAMARGQRYSPVVRALVALGPLSIRDLAGAVGVSHSAASQTAAQMARHGLLPLIEAEWAATSAVAAELEAELPAALTDVLSRAERAVLSRPMRTRIADAARALAAEPAPAGPDPGSAAGRRAALLAIAGDSEEDAR